MGETGLEWWSGHFVDVAHSMWVVVRDADDSQRQDADAWIMREWRHL